jgi:26S proteasome regulatory subunit N1
LSSVASIGLISLWDIDGGSAHIDKWTYSDDDQIKAGALLAMGIVSSTIHHESDPALAILREYVEYKNSNVRVSAILG